MTPADQQQIRSLQRQVETLEESVSKLTDSVADLVVAFNTAKGLTTFIKWFASVAAAVVMLYNLYLHGAPK